MTQSEENERKTVTLEYILGIDKKKDGEGTMLLNPLHKDADKAMLGNISVMSQRIKRIFTSKNHDNRKAVISFIKDKSLKNLDQLEYQDKSTLLHWAVRNGAEDLAVALVETYPEMVNRADVNGKTPLHAALFNSSEIYGNIIKKLRTTEKGQDAISKNDTCKEDLRINLADMVEEALKKAFSKGSLREGNNKTYIDSILRESDVPNLFVQFDKEGSLNIPDFVNKLSDIIHDHHRDFNGEGKYSKIFFHLSEASKDKLCQLDPAYEVVKGVLKNYNKDKEKGKPEIEEKEMDRQVGKILKVLRKEGIKGKDIKNSKDIILGFVKENARNKKGLGNRFTIKEDKYKELAKTLIAAIKLGMAGEVKENLEKAAAKQGLTVKKQAGNLSITK